MTVPDYSAADALAWVQRYTTALRDAARQAGDWDQYERYERAVNALALAIPLLQDEAEHRKTHERFATRSEYLHHGSDLVRYYRTTYPIAMVCRICGRTLDECGQPSEAACKAAQVASGEQ